MRAFIWFLKIYLLTAKGKSGSFLLEIKIFYKYKENIFSIIGVIYFKLYYFYV